MKIVANTQSDELALHLALRQLATDEGRIFFSLRKIKGKGQTPQKRKHCVLFYFNEHYIMLYRAEAKEFAALHERNSS